MYLQKVELHGFKSFPDKTTFDFTRGITAILGPNGCGKSNVVDAIKWVLGEKSAKSLRGSEMQDVIFSGCESRRASAMTEVSLWFDNSDQKLATPYTEVCITRRLYRSGESEYLLNKRNCRLKDIRDLLLDTGAGNSAYSVIEQGRVESLLHAKPEERRLVFEEAAGIAKFKVKRKEILSRLEKAEQILLRINDRVAEKEKQIKRVANQARAARRYKRLTEEVTRVKTYWYHQQYLAQKNRKETLLAEQDILQQQLAKEDNELNNLFNKLNSFTDEETKLNASRDDVVNFLSETQEKLAELQLKQSEIKSQVELLNNTAANTNAQKTATEERIENIKEQTKNSTIELYEVQEKLKALDLDLSSYYTKKQELNDILKQFDQEINNLKTITNSLQHKRQELTSLIAKGENEDKHQQQRITFAQEKITALNDKQAELVEAIAEKQSNYHTAQENTQQINQELLQNKNTLIKQQEDLKQLAAQEQKILTTISAQKARKTILTELEETFSGAFDGVKAILTAYKNNSNSCPGVIGMAADLMTVPQDLAIAIETIIANSAQDIVVDKAYNAQICIEYLKNNRLGRATFLPIDRLQPRRRLIKSFTHIPGVLGEAIDLISFDPAYVTVMEYLLAGVLVVEDLTLARNLAHTEARGIRIITLSGDIINPSGAMTGGQGKHQRTGLIQRKAELEAVSSELNYNEEKLTQLSSNIDTLQSEMLKSNSIVREQENKLTELNRNLFVLEKELSLSNKELTSIQQEISTLNEELHTTINNQETQELLNSYKLEMEQINTELLTNETSLNNIIEQQNNKRIENEQLNQSFATLSAQLATNKAKVIELENRIAVFKNEHSQLTNLLAELENNSNYTQKIEELADLLNQLNSSENSLLKVRDEHRSHNVEILESLTSLQENIKQARSQERDMQSQISRLNNGLAQLEFKLNDCNLRLENIYAKALEELQITDISTVEISSEPAKEFIITPDPESSDDIDTDYKDFSRDICNLSDKELQDLLSSLSIRLQKIGAVNFSAIDELVELETSAEFLLSQQEDISTAVNDMKQTVERLSKESASKFQETFLSVKNNFQIMFVKLFGGGKADIFLEELIDPEADPLEAGIDIKAQPPGKEPKNISLLSGGEKALCAVALLLALFQSKPSPFCILDEVDGPLDESNIDRFMQQIKEFSEHTQFILISHSKRTMSMVDTIWGVTQTEPGVSTRYSLKFSNLEETIDNKTIQTDNILKNQSNTLADVI